MTHEYTPNGTVWEALVELIDDSDQPTAANFNAGPTGNADRTQFLYNNATLFGGTEYTSSTTLVVNANVNHIFLDGFGGGGGGMPGTSGSALTTTSGLGGSGGRGSLRYHQTARVLAGETLAIAIGVGGSGTGGGLDGGYTTVVGSVSGLIFSAPGGAGAGAGSGAGFYFTTAGGSTSAFIYGAQGESRGPSVAPRTSSFILESALALSPLLNLAIPSLPGDGGTMFMNSAGSQASYNGLPQFQFNGGAGGTTAGSGTYLSGGGGGGGGAGPGGNGGNGGTGGSHNDSGVGAAGSGLTSAAANTGAGGGGAGGGGSGSGGGGLPGNAGAGGSGWLRICEIYYSPHP